MDLFDELLWRGLAYQWTGEDALPARLRDGPITLYCGFDPSAPSLHIGNLVGLTTLRRFQKAGHHPIAVAGGGTGMIGDPSGKSEERNLLSESELAENVASIRAQIARFLDFDAGASLVNNADWLGALGYIEFLRDVGKHFSVNAMLAKESVRARLESRAGISYTEFSYMLMQAYDFVHLHETAGCELQVGGSDQFGNISVGVDLGRRMHGVQLFGLTWPLVTRSDGVKMGKTAEGAVWLDPARTSPYAFYQWFVNVPDADAGPFLRFFTELPREEIEALEADVARAPAEHPACAPAAAAPWARTRARGLEVLALVLALAHVLVHAHAQALRLLIGLAPLSLFSRALGLHFGGLELGGDQRVVLRAQVHLLVVIGGRGALGELLLAHEVVLALELLDLGRADPQLMRDPGGSAALSYPGADLVEVRAQGFPGHLECGETSALSFARGPGRRRYQNGTIARCLRRREDGPCGFSPKGSLSPGAGVMLGAPVVGGLAPDCCQRKGARMLVLTRKSNQSIMIGDDVEVSVLSVMGENSRMGVIVAAPTAGAGGVVPGMLLALEEERNVDPEKTVRALVVAGGIGSIIALSANISGAAGGCQNEVGVASSMGAAAVAYMMGGKTRRNWEPGLDASGAVAAGSPP